MFSEGLQLRVLGPLPTLSGPPIRVIASCHRQTVDTPSSIDSGVTFQYRLYCEVYNYLFLLCFIIRLKIVGFVFGFETPSFDELSSAPRLTLFDPDLDS